MVHRFFAIALILISLAASSVQAGTWQQTSLKRAKNIYPLTVYGEKDAHILMKQIRKRVSGRKIVIGDDVLRLAEPIRSIKLDKTMLSLEVDSTGRDFDLLVDNVLLPLEEAKARLIAERERR